MIAATTVENVSLHYDPVGSWIFVAAVAAALAAVLVAIPPDRSRAGGGRRWVLVGLRLGAFLALVACMLRPAITATRKARQQGTVIVLADASESMTVADGPGGRTRWEEMRAALDAARPAARALTAGGDFDVALSRFDRGLAPVAAAADDPFPLDAWADAATADETAIGAAIDDAARAAGGRTVAGVIVLSDGAQHAYAPRDLPPQSAARRLAEAGVPLWSVTFGQQRAEGQGRDVAVVNLSVADTVYVKNAIEVSGRVRLEGLAGREVEVRLLAEEEAGRMEQVAAARVKTAGESGEETVRLAWTPRAVGERKLTLSAAAQDGEVVVANNELSTFVDVIEGGLRVLYLEGALRVEQRFLRRALAASPDMQVDFQWIDSAKRSRWPVDLGRVVGGDYDVFLVGDLDAAALRPEDQKTILAKVNAGAGIAFLGGAHAFEAGGWAASELRGLVPFAADPLARQPFDQPVRESLHLPGPLKMLPDPQRGDVSILRLGKDGDQRAAWAALPTLEGANRLGRLVPSATPLAVTQDGAPLLVARDYGGGRVIAFAADSTWRWVMQGAGQQHARFWRQLVLWLARQDEAEGDTLWVRLAQRRISPGTPLEFDAGLTAPDGKAAAGATLEARVVSPSGQKRPVRVARQGESFAGTITDCAEPGDWSLVVTATRPGAPSRERTARFTVFRQDLELANPRANPLLMRQLAEATTGGVRLPEEIPAIFEEIGARPPVFESQEQWSWTPWDKWPPLLLMAACLCVEWFLRKRWGLV
ncbi:MAG: hypothetical protein ACKOZU_04185 [Planctomycetaceae bacterium]